MKPTDPRGRWALYASHLGTYMRRWILRTPWFNLRLHNIMQSDEGRDFHDHPFDFCSLILRGGYVEHRPGCQCWPWIGDTVPTGDPPCHVYGPGSVVRRQAEDLHRLELVGNKPAWTLVVASPYRREWGFRLKDGTWIHWEEYHRLYT